MTTTDARKRLAERLATPADAGSTPDADCAECGATDLACHASCSHDAGNCCEACRATAGCTHAGSTPDDRDALIRDTFAAMRARNPRSDFTAALLEFDEWLAEHDRQVAAKAWFEGYDKGNLDGYFGTSDERAKSPYAGLDPCRADRIGGDA